MFTLKVLSSVFIIILVLYSTKAEYDIPDLKIEAVKEKGLRVSLPDEPGVQLLEFHANINKDIEENELGDIFNRVSAAYKGNWTFDDKTIKLKKGDVLNYWITVYHNGEIYKKHGYTFTVEDLVD